MFVALRRIGVVAILVLASAALFTESAQAITATGTQPQNGSHVNAPATVRVIHDVTLDPSGSSIIVRDKDNATVAGSTSFATSLTTPNDTIVFTPSATLTQAKSPYSVTAVGKELGLTPAQTSTFFTFFVDDTAPAQPTIANFTNPVNAGNKDAVAVTGVAEPGTTVSVYIEDANQGVLKQVTAGSGAGNNYFATLDLTPLNDGALAISVSATDAAYNVSAVAAAATFKDTIVPANPTITVADDPVTASNQAAVTLSGTTAEDPLTIQVSVNDTNANTAPVTAAPTSSGGVWTIDVDLTSLDQGTLTASATAYDAGNNPSGTVTDAATKETGPPVLRSTSPSNSSTAQPPAKITATYDEVLSINSTISMVNGSAQAVAGTKSFENGDTTIAFTPTSPLTDAGNPFTVTVTGKDLGGNTQTPSSTFIFSVDSTPPPVPVITGTDSEVRPVNAANFAVNGTAETGSTVQVTVTDSGSATATAMTTASSPWNLTVNVGALADGLLTVTAKATDAAGNVSPASAAVQVTKHATNLPFSSVAQNIAGTYKPISGDFDNDGLSDIFWYAPGSAPDPLWLSNGDGTYTVVASGISGTYTPIAGDFDGQDGTDIFWYAPGSAPDSIWFSDGDGTFTSVARPISGTYTPITGDFDGDGLTDIFWYAPGPGADYLWLSDGDGTFTSVTSPISGTPTPITGDFDDDGLTDIFWYAPGSAPDSIWFSDGDGTFTSIARPISGTYTPITGDFDDDGLTDIFWYAPGPGADYLWLSNGDGTFAAVTLSISGTYTPITGDFDAQDGTDIFWYAPGSAPDYLWLSNGDSTFTSIARPISGTYHPITGDHDGDGDTDIFWYKAGPETDYLWLAVITTPAP